MTALWNCVKAEGLLLNRREAAGVLFQRDAAGGMEHACVLLQVFKLWPAHKRKRLPITQVNL